MSANSRLTEAATFRDPDGFCVQVSGRILRVVRPHAADRVRAFIGSEFFARWVQGGHIPATRPLNADEVASVLPVIGGEALVDAGQMPTILEQKRIEFVSYAHEWPPEMLYAAAELTLDLQLQALEHGLMLKDATPSNVLFRGTKPVFVDVLSFVPRPQGSAIWPAYAQFVRTFVLPLMMHRHDGAGTHHVFLSRRDGLEPEEAYARLPWAKRLTPTALKCVSLPTWLGHSRAAKTAAPATVKPMPEERAKALAPMLIGGLRRSLRAVRPRPHASTWSDYMATNTYDEEALKVKEDFVRDALARWSARTILDVGCNTGHFSRIAAGLGASVVALDYDPMVVGAAFSASRRDESSVLPLVVNLAWPSPGLGWANRENASFSARAEGTFDAALFLAVVHHLTVTDGVPLAEVFRVIASLVTKGAVVEFVPPTDPQFQRIARNKEHLIERLSRADFERELACWFEIGAEAEVPRSDRVLYRLNRQSR